MILMILAHQFRTFFIILYLNLICKNYLIAEYNVAEKMAKLILYVFIALLAASLIMSAPDRCGRHGDPVSTYSCMFFW